MATLPAVNLSENLNLVSGLPQPFASKLWASLPSPPLSAQPSLPELFSVLWKAPPDPTFSQDTIRAASPHSPNISLKAKCPLWTHPPLCPLMDLQRSWVGGGRGRSSIPTHLCARSLLIQLPPEQVQLLLLELLLTAHHV